MCCKTYFLCNTVVTSVSTGQDYALRIHMCVLESFDNLILNVNHLIENIDTRHLAC